MTPRTADQNQALRDATRERLLEAALKVFGRLGYEAASVRLIAGEAGVAQGLMYSHFKGKEDLLKALFRRGMDQVRESFAAASGEDDRPPLERLVVSALDLIRDNLDFWRLSYGVRMQPGVVKALGRDLEGWTTEILAVLQTLFKASGAADPRIEAALFFAAFDGLCQHFVLDPARYPLEKVSAALLERFTPAAPKPKGRTHGKARRR
jgi:AcrR family transcriptional regulator